MAATDPILTAITMLEGRYGSGGVSPGVPPDSEPLTGRRRS